MSFLPEDFLTYIAEETNRADFIQNWLLKNEVKSNRIVIDGKNHILVQFPKEKYNSSFRIKTVIAHHDRVKNSPGANDNSAANWQLMNWAVHLNSKNSFHNVRIIFTDGEELGWNAGIREQGAFAIASTFKRLGITNDDVYVFDACGRGNVSVLAKNSIPKNAPQDFTKKFNSLYLRAQNILASANPSSWLTLPVPYSDNASFLASGIPAVAITMLPADESALYMRELLNNKNLEDAVMNREKSHQDRISGNQVDFNYKEKLPLTWRLFHSQNDNISSLTKDAFVAMGRILSVLENVEIPLI